SHILHAAIRADHGHQHYYSFNPRPTSLRRILRRNVVDQVGLDHPGGDTDSLNRRRVGRFRNDGDASRAAQHFAEHSTRNSAHYSTRDSPTTPPVVPTGGGGASCVLCAGVGMAMLVGVYVDGSEGARSFVALLPAGGGCRYSIVSVSLLGSGSV